MAWTVTGRDKMCDFDSSRQGQEMWPGQFSAGTRDVAWTVPGRDKMCDLDSSRQGQEMWPGQFSAGATDVAWTVPGMNKRFSSFISISCRG